MPNKKKKGAAVPSGQPAFTKGDLVALDDQLARFANSTFCTWLNDRGPFPNAVRKVEQTHGDPTAPTPYEAECFSTKAAAEHLAHVYRSLKADATVKP